MGYLARNNAYSTLAAGISNSATSLSVQTSHGDRFPVIVAPDYTYLTLENAGGTREVVKVTARALGSDVMTIERAQDNTSAQAWSAADVVDLRLVAAVVVDAFTHIAQATAAHLATAISFAPTAGIAATNVQAAIAELEADITSIITPALALKANIADPTFTGTVTIPNATITAGTIAGQDIGYKLVPQNAQNAGYTFALADEGKHIFANTAGTFTIPANASVAFPIGSAITLVNTSGSNCTVAITTDTLKQAGSTNTGSSRTLSGTNGIATLLKVAATTWLISGVGIS